MNWGKFIYTLFVVCSCCLLLLSAPSKIVTLALAAMSMVLFLEPVTLLPLLFVTSISSSIVVIPGIAGYFYYTFLFVVGCFVRYKFKPSVNFRILWILVYVIWLLVSAQLSVSQNTAPATRMAFAIVPIMLVPNFSFSETKVRRYMLLGAIAISITIALKLLIDPVLYSPGAYNPYYTDDVAVQLTFAEQVNPNTAAQCLLLSFIVIYIYAINHSKWNLLIVSLIPLIPIVMIGSRTVYIAVICVAIISFIVWAKTKSYQKIVIVLLLAIFGGLILEGASSINERLMLESITDDQGSGRFYTWDALFNNVIPIYFISGIGFGRSNLDAIGYYVDADNMYVDALCQLGVVGVVVLLVMLIALGGDILKKHTTVSRMALAMLLFVFIVGFGETVFDTFIFVYILLFLLISKQSQYQ